MCLICRLFLNCSPQGHERLILVPRDLFRVLYEDPISKMVRKMYFTVRGRDRSVEEKYDVSGRVKKEVL